MKHMIRPLFLGLLFTATTALNAQESVCNLFSHLDSFAEQNVAVTGDLIISKDIAVLGAADCDFQYSTILTRYPTALKLRPSISLPSEQLQLLQNAAARADALRSQGKTISATASFSGRIHIAPAGGIAAELIFDSVENLRVEELPDPRSLPVTPICELFQNLSAWKGKRVAVSGELVSTMEGAWIGGRCESGFVTDGYRWPVSISYASPAYHSVETEGLYKIKVDALENGKELQGMHDVERTGIFVGVLRVRSNYYVSCDARGNLRAVGFGHLNGAAAELIVDGIYDFGLAPRPDTPQTTYKYTEQPCAAAEIATLCSNAVSLASAAGIGCTDKVRDFLAKDGIDSKGGTESPALRAAIRAGNESLVKLLVDAGAPLNPVGNGLNLPLTDAVIFRHVEIVKLLLQAGAKADNVDSNGTTALVGYGFSDPNVARILVEAGAKVDAVDKKGRTALMKAAGPGLKHSIKILIDHHADVNLRDASGRTALMYAAAGPFSDAIPLLLESGADPNVRDNSDKSALDMANASKNLSAIALLDPATKTSH
jgi:ankyrin repeat protein